jgi:hypothetical protein
MGDNIMLSLLYFFSGLLVGFLLVIAIVYYVGKRSVLKAAESKKIISDRLSKVKELTSLQLELQKSISGPQKNSLDGKHKNYLMRELKDIEEEKTEILKSIISDGHDPVISTMDTAGVVTKGKLSEFLAQHGIVVEGKNTQQIEQKPVNKFTVVQGGKFESDDGDGSETVH